MPILRSSTCRAPLLNLQINNNNNKDGSEALKQEKSAKNSKMQKSSQISKVDSEEKASPKMLKEFGAPPLTLQDVAIVNSSVHTIPDTAKSTVLPINVSTSDQGLSSPRSVDMSVGTSSDGVAKVSTPTICIPEQSPRTKSGSSRYSGKRSKNKLNRSQQGNVRSNSLSPSLPHSSDNALPAMKTVILDFGRKKESIEEKPLPDHLATLESVMRQQGCYETRKGLEARQEVLACLNPLVREWIKSIGLGRRMQWHNVDNIGGRIVTYGSYMLGISHQGADIDALCVAPNFISRSEYFNSFYAYLSCRHEVTELRAIEEAYVPVIKFRYNGIEIDMTFTQLTVEQVPVNDDDLLDVQQFNHNNLDPKCLRSLNGYRATRLIMKLVPDLDKFCVTLRAIKLWAQSQGIYSNILGYLGGFSWAVLVARVCMDYPSLSGPELVQKFFHVFKVWLWPEPVALTKYQEDDNQVQNWDMSIFGSTPSLSWNPEKNVQERYQVMPILTPTYPHQNSTFNVTSNTLKLIKEKMSVAAEICDNIFKGQETWENLFQTRHIFHEYEHFLIVVASALQTSTQQPILWFGLIESKIRYLVNNLEKECRNNLDSARIWPKPFAKKAEKSNTSRHLWFIGLKFRSQDNFDYSRPLQSFHEMLLKQSTPFYTRDMRVDAHFVLKSQLTSHLSEVEIQEIVSSQSQKAREVPPVRLSSRPNSGEMSPTSTSANEKLSPNSASAVTKTDGHLPNQDRAPHHGLHNLHPPNLLRPLQQAPVPMPLHPGFYNSPRSNNSPTLRIQHQQYPTPHQRSPPVMERTWASGGSGQGPFLNNSHSTKFSFGSSVGGMYQERNSTGGDSSTSSAGGLEISYNSLESDNVRSVSYSSDKFPPQVLVQARIQHQLDRIPFPPICQTNSGGCGNLYGTPAYDSTVPPPPSPNLPNPQSFAAAATSRPVALSSQQSINYSKSKTSVTQVRISHLPNSVDINALRPWLEFFGQIIEEPRYLGNDIFCVVKLDIDIPEFLSVEGHRVRVFYYGIPKSCFRCYESGHISDSCKNATISWAEHLRKFQIQYRIPKHYFKEFRIEQPRYLFNFYPGGYSRRLPSSL